MTAHPDEAAKERAANRSYVFFRVTGLSNVKPQTGTSFTQIQYPQNQQRLSDLLSGRTQFAYFNTPAVVDLVTTGKLRAMALAGPKRVAVFKDVPTVIEAGFSGLAAVAPDRFGPANQERIITPIVIMAFIATRPHWLNALGATVNRFTDALKSDIS